MAEKTKNRARAHVIRRLDQVRVLAHPLRLRLFEAFARGPKTTKQAAELLSLPPTRLYHHAQALERAGLIRLKETRPNRGTVEKHYEAVAEQVSLDPTMFHGAAARRATGSGGVLAARVLDMAKADLEASLRSVPKLAVGEAPIAMRVGISTTPKKLVAIHRRLLRFIDAVRREAGDESPRAESRDASLTIAFVPSIPPARPAGKRAPSPRRKDS